AIGISGQEQPRSVEQPYTKTASHAVMPVNFETPGNKTAPPRKSRTADMKLGESRKDTKQEKTYNAPGGMSSLVTIVGSLALVIGLFLIVAFLMRRNTPTANMPLPDEVIEILGRAPLANRQQVHLVRCGNKLLLVCVTPNGTETLTEITDPAEVDRLAALCRRNNNSSSTANFRQVFEQLSWENTPSKLTGGRA
ncbi:MAG: flagellar biosynthetic protein FliO, partial [Pirellulales bacterium]|nr:flagellar biosynthetic protein FliO [Pirellulales bacterium]